MEIEIFGYKLGSKLGDDKREIPNSFSTPTNNDGAAEKTVSSSPLARFGGADFDLDKSIAKLSGQISTYRSISRHPTLDMAISEIVNEAIVMGDNEDVVTVDCDTTKFSESVKKKIQTEFQYIIYELLDFQRSASDIFRQYYIEGVIHGHKIFDEKSPKKGILQVNILDAANIKKVREIEKEKRGEIEYVKGVNEYFLYHDEGLLGKNNVLKIHPELIAMATSGIIDKSSGTPISFIDKCIRPLNMLKYAEDAQLIYRISRAPERRVFYIDIGMMNGSKAEQYIGQIMDKFRNKMIYDPNTGEMKSTRNYQAFTEDYWLPRKEGGKGTEVTTLPGGTNLSQIEDILFFQQSLYRSLNVPIGRLEGDNGFNIGRVAEITREEIKFAKFIFTIRARFSEFLLDILKTQLILKGVITKEDWKKEKRNIKIRYNRDNYYDELKKIEVLKEKLDLLGNIDAYVGKYFSEEYVFKEVLEFSDEEIEKIRKTNKDDGYDDEDKDGSYTDDEEKSEDSDGEKSSENSDD